MKLPKLDDMHYRPSEEAKKVLLKRLKEKKKTNPRMSVNMLLDELVISKK